MKPALNCSRFFFAWNGSLSSSLWSVVISLHFHFHLKRNMVLSPIGAPRPTGVPFSFRANSHRHTKKIRTLLNGWVYQFTVSSPVQRHVKPNWIVSEMPVTKMAFVALRRNTRRVVVPKWFGAEKTMKAPQKLVCFNSSSPDFGSQSHFETSFPTSWQGLEPFHILP